MTTMSNYNYKKNPILHRPAQADELCIRVRLNSKTVVLLKSMKSFAQWKERYPDAVVLDPVVDDPASDVGAGTNAGAEASATVPKKEKTDKNKRTKE
jgi:hypothetical protein